MFGVCWWAKIMSSDSSVNSKVIRVESNADVSVLAVNKVSTTQSTQLTLKKETKCLYAQSDWQESSSRNICDQSKEIFWWHG